jgi:flagellar biogenesis protein FliO
MFKKRIVLISVVLVLCVVGQVLLRPRLCRADEDTATTDKSKATSKGELSTWSLDDLDFDKGPNQSQGKLRYQFALAIGFVVLLGGCAWYVSKKLGRKLGIARGKDISIIETVHLGSRKTLHLLEVGGRQTLLIGSTNENISILADVTEAVSSPLEQEVL